MRFLITGTAGFIGYHLAQALLGAGHDVIGLDGFTAYYDTALKAARSARLARHPGYVEHRILIEEPQALDHVWGDDPVDVVVHLAAQAGVRYSLDNPRAYLAANITGTFNLLEAIRTRPVRHLLLASTSSVYGCNASVPFREIDGADHPLTFYAATKRSTELMAHSYAHLWGIPTTALRFFTVYGPWGRPDMAPYRFVDAIATGKPIQIYNHGRLARDFTYVADAIEAVSRLIDRPPAPPAQRAGTTPIEGDSLSPVAAYRVVNIGGGAPTDLLRFIALLEEAVGRPAERHYVDMQPGDVPRTFADVALLEALTGYKPSTPLADGVAALVDWYRTEWPG